MLQNADYSDAAFDALCQIGPAARAALPALVKFVDDRNGLLILETLEEREKTGLSGSAMVKAIVQLMHSRSSIGPRTERNGCGAYSVQRTFHRCGVATGQEFGLIGPGPWEAMRLRAGRDAGAD